MSSTASTRTPTIDPVVDESDLSATIAARPASPVAARFGLTDEQLDAFGAELDSIRARILDDRGA